jgi:hypothetical protein
LHRDILAIIFLAGVFELLVRATIAKASIGPFELNDLSLIRKLLPVLVAYFFFDLCATNLRRQELYIAAESLVEKLHPSVHSSRIHMLLVPRQPTVLGITMLAKSKISGLLYSTSAIPGIIVAILPILFMVYAYIVQFREFGVKDILTWLTLVVSLFLIALGLLTIEAGSQSS